MTVNGKDQQIILRLSAEGKILSGEELSRELDISRVALWKRIHKLQERGCPLISSSRGYRFNAAALDGDLWRDAAKREEASPAALVDTLTNTMDEARQPADKGAPEGFLILAGHQEKGRDRQDRPFPSPPGGFYGALLLRPAGPLIAAADLQPLGAWAAALCLGEDYSARWPGDILQAPRIKAGGAKLELRGTLDHLEWGLLGIGIPPAALPPGVDRPLLARRITETIIPWSRDIRLRRRIREEAFPGKTFTKETPL